MRLGVNWRVGKSGGNGQNLHSIIKDAPGRLFSSGISCPEGNKAIDGNAIKFMSEDNDLMARGLNRGIVVTQTGR